MERKPGASRADLTSAEETFALAQRVGRLATSDAAGTPTAVPVCYAFEHGEHGQRFYIALDEKPKHVAPTALRRVRNILARGEAALLIDHYADDWSQLGYLLIHARAELIEPGAEAHTRAVGLLRERYAQYRTMAIEAQPVIALTPMRVTSWGPAIVPGEVDHPGSEWLRAGRGGDFLALAQGRRSVRTFYERPVPRPALEAMLEAARWAPSPHGRQPWRFVVLTRAEAKAHLAAAMGEEWERTLAMDGQDEATIALRLEKSRQRIRTAPALIVACLYLADLDVYPDAERQRDEEIMAIQSLGAAIQNMLLAAYAEGLDTGWMCAPLFAPEAVRAALGLDASLIPHALIPVGYLAAEPKRRPHRPWQELVVRFD